MNNTKSIESTQKKTLMGERIDNVIYLQDMANSLLSRLNDMRERAIGPRDVEDKNGPSEPPGQSLAIGSLECLERELRKLQVTIKNMEETMGKLETAI